jgi:hypothetical protein
LHEIAPCLVHPIEQPDVAVEREIGKSRRIAWVQLDPADGIGLCRALRTLAARFEGRADAADEVDAGIIAGGKLERYFAGAQVARLVRFLSLIALFSGAADEMCRACRVCELGSNALSGRPKHP